MCGERVVEQRVGLLGEGGKGFTVMSTLALAVTMSSGLNIVEYIESVVVPLHRILPAEDWDKGSDGPIPLNQSGVEEVVGELVK